MSDFAVKLEEARGMLPLKRLMEQRGRGPANGNWRKFPECPYCQKDGASVVEEGKQEWFKCWHTSCRSGTSGKGEAWDEIRFLMFELSLNRKDAAITLMKEAGVWKEREAYAPSVMPGKASRKNKIPTDPWADEDHDQSETPAPVLATEGMASAPHVVAPTAQPDVARESTKSVNPSDSERIGTLAAGDHSEQEQSGGEAQAASPSASDAPVSPAVDASVPPAGPNTQTQVGAVTGEVTSKEGSLAAEPGAPAISEVEVKVHEPDGRRALKDFYERLTLSEQDEAKLFHKRGLKATTSLLAGLKSSPRSNKDILLELEVKYGREEMERSGLWSKANKQRGKDARPNAQFFGYGIIRKAKDGEKASKGEWLDDDGNLWGWTEPILIPYFDDKGIICGLRPHKGGGKGDTLVGTPQPYIPLRHRQVGPLYTVVITEGEFKALALLQTVGILYPNSRSPLGVAALPGITFGKNWELREMLDDWLKSVGCQRVIITFDNEEKGDKEKYPASYKEKQDQRFDSQKWSRYLATSLFEEIHVTGMVCTLPNDWRNEKGKADWDGALATIIK